MATAARDDDLLNVQFRVFTPEWINEIVDEDEFDNLMEVAKDRAIEAFCKELNKAERFWRERRKKTLEGQMDIYDYA